MLCFFFFKQKTAYEMRISDWSSDVCSSDLRDDGLFYRLLPERKGRLAAGGRFQVLAFSERERGRDARNWGDDYPFASGAWRRVRRSEEHTSELQSLMRSSYADFCLKKKKQLRSINEATINTFFTFH